MSELDLFLCLGRGDGGGQGREGGGRVRLVYTGQGVRGCAQKNIGWSLSQFLPSLLQLRSSRHLNVLFHRTPIYNIIFPRENPIPPWTASSEFHL